MHRTISLTLSSAFTTKSTAKTESDGSKEHSSPRAPSPAKCPSTETGIDTIASETVAGLDEFSSHKGSTKTEPEECKDKNAAGEIGCETTAWSKKTGEKSANSEEEAHEVENPTKSPQIEEVCASSTFAVAPNQRRWSTLSATNPSISKW